MRLSLALLAFLKTVGTRYKKIITKNNHEKTAFAAANENAAI
jgi:hypothetical protein